MLKFDFKNNKLNIKKTLILALISALFLSVFQVIMQIGNAGITSFVDGINPLILAINTSIYFLVMLFFFFITGKFNISFILVTVITQLLLIVNYYKIHFLSVPLKASDLILGKEATGIIGNYSVDLSVKVVFLTLFLIFVCVIVFKYLKSEKVKFIKRFAGLITVVAVSFLLYTYIYSDYNIYQKSVFITNEFSEVDVANGHGFMYSFINGISRTKYKKPDGYEREAVKAILKDEIEENNTPPNVIAIMSEAFFDIKEAKNLKFYKNPLSNYMKLKQEGIYGDIIVPGFAGNTSSSEFEFLSGVNISLIDKGMPVPYKTFLNKKVYALPQYFKEFGFNTVAMHPGHNWFYNRVMAYNCMGFSRSVFLENLSYKPEMTNYYANDTEMAKMIIDDYNEHLSLNPADGYFNFAVTIQNHGPYIPTDTGKEKLVKRLDGMTDTEYFTLENYAQGLKDADDFLKTIKDYIESIDKPTVVVFFGDHLPFLDSELKTYDMIGYDITSGTDAAIYRKHKTPYLIFSNYAFKKDQREKGNRVLKGKQSTISSSYLATELFKYMNVKMPSYFNYINELKKEINIISPHYYMVKNQFTYELSEELTEKIKVLKDLQYYNMMEYKK